MDEKAKAHFGSKRKNSHQTFSGDLENVVLLKLALSWQAHEARRLHVAFPFQFGHSYLFPKKKKT